jgi:cyclopropane-fatty-acyl-phospholipid synthase
MPEFPLTEIFVDTRVEEKVGFVDQNFHICEKCGHGQIANVIDPDIMYGNYYRTRTATSSSATSAIDVFLNFVNRILADRPIRNLFEIGCNDLYTLQRLRHRADILYGVDPILRGQEDLFSDDKIRIVGDFFENVDVAELGKMDVVLSSHTLEHIEDPKSMIAKILKTSADDAVIFFQFPGLESLIEDAHFDQIFHQHLNYFSLESILHLLDEVGAELVAFEVNPYHWGALMIAFRKRLAGLCLNDEFKKRVFSIPSNLDLVHKQYDLFKEGIRLTAERIDSIRGKTIYGYGAALMTPVLEYYLRRLGSLKCIIDEDETKKDLFYLNVPVQIKMLNQISDIEKSVILITAINSLQAIRPILMKLIGFNVEKIILPVNLI